MGKKKHSKRTKNVVKSLKSMPCSTSFTITEDEIVTLINDTSEIVAKDNATRLSSIGSAVGNTETLTNSVEFWNWMNRNYSKCGHFASTENMRDADEIDTSCAFLDFKSARSFITNETMNKCVKKNND